MNVRVVLPFGLEKQCHSDHHYPLLLLGNNALKYLQAPGPGLGGVSDGVWDTNTTVSDLVEEVAGNVISVVAAWH